MKVKQKNIKSNQNDHRWLAKGAQNADASAAGLGWIRRQYQRIARPNERSGWISHVRVRFHAICATFFQHIPSWTASKHHPVLSDVNHSATAVQICRVNSDHSSTAWLPSLNVSLLSLLSPSLLLSTLQHLRNMNVGQRRVREEKFSQHTETSPIPNVTLKLKVKKKNYKKKTLNCRWSVGYLRLSFFTLLSFYDETQLHSSLKRWKSGVSGSQNNCAIRYRHLMCGGRVENCRCATLPRFHVAIGPTERVYTVIYGNFNLSPTQRGAMRFAE